MLVIDDPLPKDFHLADPYLFEADAGLPETAPAGEQDDASSMGVRKGWQAIPLV